MARAKTAKKSASKRRGSSSNSLSGLFKWVKNNRMWLFVLLFSVAGTYYLVMTFAFPALPPNPDDIVVGYVKQSATSVAQDEDGNLSYELHPASTYVLVDGSLVCDSGASSGSAVQTVQTGKLTKKEVEKLQRAVADTDIGSLPDSVAPEGSDGAFVDFEGIMIADGESAKGTAVYQGATKPDKFTKAQQKLEAECAKATKTENRKDIKTPREPNLKSKGKKSAVTRANDWLFPKVSACCSVGTASPATEADQASKINLSRYYRGLRNLPRHACWDEKSRIWAGQMAAKGTISHDSGMGSQGNSCFGSGRWGKLGENVGVGPTSAGLYNAFVQSPSHFANIVDPAWTHQGQGAVKHPDGRLFVVQRYAQLR